MAVLTSEQRKRMAKSTFAIPGRRAYPLPDESHGRNALARVSQFGTPSEKATVRAAVHRRFPGITMSGAVKTMRRMRRHSKN